MSSNRQNPQRLVQEVMEEAETRSAGRTKVRVHDPTVRKRRQMGKQKKGHAHILQNELHLVFLNNVLHPPAGRSGRSQTPDTAGGGVTGGENGVVFFSRTSQLQVRTASSQ